MKSVFRLSVLCLTLFLMSGCSSFGKKWKAFLNEGQPQTKQASDIPARDDRVKYSDVKDLPVDGDRQYRRMTKRQFEDQELFSDNGGSLWVNEGQDSYLFAQNIVRMPGDILNVLLDGQPEKQLSTKATVIKELTKRIEKNRRGVASTEKPEGAPAEGANAETADADQAQAQAKPDAQKVAGQPEPGLPEGFDVKSVPTRVVERMSDGNYRVNGSQTFMIGTKEYKVIVTGLVKPQDIANDSVDSSKMLDSKFDIVRYNKGKTL